MQYLKIKVIKISIKGLKRLIFLISLYQTWIQFRQECNVLHSFPQEKYPPKCSHLISQFLLSPRVLVQSCFAILQILKVDLGDLLLHDGPQTPHEV